MVKLSYTANAKYQLSPRAYYLHYLLKLREEKVGSALAFGNAMDLAINSMLKNKQLHLSEKDEGYKDPIETFDYSFKKMPFCSNNFL